MKRGNRKDSENILRLCNAGSPDVTGDLATPRSLRHYPCSQAHYRY